ncbi:MAG: dUTP diphosphatase [Epsilonproteobacteria bacterium]|nr:MAG: dUTP diphosphatase [Campylobacterota bacterium]
MNKVGVKVLKLEHFDDQLPLPQYESTHAAGADIRACLKLKTLSIKPGERVLIPTGLSFEIPQGFEIQIRPRSGLSLKTNLLVVNSPGTIDADYRGELKVIMGNIGEVEHTISHGDRIAQMILAPVIQASFEISKDLSATARGASGFGSTGMN